MTAFVNDRYVRLINTVPRYVSPIGGLKSATLLIFKRTITGTAPAVPSVSSTYDHSTGVLSGLNNGWSTDLPLASDGAYLWASIFYASSNTGTVAVPSASWPVARLMSDAAPVIAAQTDATNALNNAALSAAAIDAMTRDDILSPSEKPAENARWTEIVNEFPTIYNRGNTLGLATQRDAYGSAYNNLNTYIAGLGAQFSTIPGVNISIVGTTYSSMFQAYRDARQALLDKIYEITATKAVWASGITGRPSDAELLNSYAVAAAAADAAARVSLITLGADGSLGGGATGQATLSGMGLKNWRVIAVGGVSNTHPAASGLYLNGVMMYGSVRSYMFVAINRATGVADHFQTYDVYDNGALTAGRNGDNLRADLNFYGSSHIIVVWTYDEAAGRRLENGLPEAMYRHGASRSVFGSPNFIHRSAYILVGVGGCGEGNGAEGYQGSVVNDANAWCDIGFSILNGNLMGVSTSFKPKSLTDYGYTGAMDASSDISLKEWVAGGHTITGNRISGASGTFNFCAGSSNNQTGGAFCEFVPEPNAYFVAGLKTSANDPLNITYGFICRGDNIMSIRNSGGEGVLGAYVAGDVYAVKYDGSTVFYFKNGNTVYSVPNVAANQGLYFLTSIVNYGISRIRFGPLSSNNWVSIGGSDKPSDGATTDLALIASSNMVLTGNSAVKTGPGGWDASVHSRDGYVGGAYASAVVGSQSSIFMGLNTNGDGFLPATGYDRIDYAIYYDGGAISLWINGGMYSNPGWTGVVGDVLAVVYDGSTIIWLKNGAVLTAVAAVITTPMYFDSSFHTPGAMIKNIRFGPLSSNAWGSIGGAGKPENGATVGAPTGTNVAGVPAATVVANASSGATVAVSFNNPPVLSGIGDIYADGVYKPAVIVGTISPSVSGGTAPFRFDWSMNNIVSGDADITYTISSITYPNDRLVIKGLCQITGGSETTDKVTCTTTDSRGRVSTTQFLVTVSG